MIPNGLCLCETQSRAHRPQLCGENYGKGWRVLAGPLISIIDDDESMRSALVALVRSADYDGRGFVSAEAFLSCGIVQDFACIITDIQMPEMSGIELKQHLTKCQSRVPVIMITARNDSGIEEKALASGAVSFLRKPFEAQELIECLQRALKN